MLFRSIGGAVLSIVAEKMASKAFSEGTGRSRVKGSRTREYLSGRGEYPSAIRELDVLGSVPGGREGIIFFVGKVVIRCGRVYCGGRRGSRRRWRRRYPSGKRRWYWASKRGRLR